MLENLTARLARIVKQVRGEARLTEANIEDALREVRIALLEADVALPVAKAFIAGVKARALGEEVVGSLSPGQAFVGVVHRELARLMGEAGAGLNLAVAPPAVILMAGLQGSGKTTTVGKLARLLRAEQKKKVLVVSADVYRPAAIEQLKTVAAQAGAEFLASDPNENPVHIARRAVDFARTHYHDVVIVDTAGRLAIDEQMMREIAELEAALAPAETLFVVDAMQGQDAVNVARAFAERLPLTGVILTKLDGDARGGAALSVVSVVGVPIAFMGTGERLEDLEPFHADRFVSRMLGMGDVLTLIERAEEAVDASEAERLEQKIRRGGFTLEDFRDQLRALKRMGPLEHILGLLPGMSGVKQLADQKPDERQLRRVEAIIGSMTTDERRHAEIIDGSRRKRIARGSGTAVEDVNRLLKQFGEMQRMLKMVGRMTGEPIAAPPRKKKKSPFSLMK